MEKLKFVWDQYAGEYVCLTEHVRYRLKHEANVWRVRADKELLNFTAYEISYDRFHQADTLISEHYDNFKKTLNSLQDPNDNLDRAVDCLKRIMDLTQKQTTQAERYIYLDARDVLRQLNKL